ncbi:MAG: hypothetical protein II574_04110 [Ruminococcus sp.]|nr:hypothetical protein [Ruminococcus sp.]
MSDYINKSAAMSVCSTNRAYSTLQDISNLPCAKVVDREQYWQACYDVFENSKMWKNAPMGEISDYMWWAAEVGEILFGGAK